MVRPRGLVRAAPPHLSFRPTGVIIGRQMGVSYKSKLTAIGPFVAMNPTQVSSVR